MIEEIEQQSQEEEVVDQAQEEESVEENREVPEDTGGPEPEPVEDNKWFILQVRGGREEKVKKQIEQKLRSEGLQDEVRDIYVPKEKVSKIKNGERTVHEKKLFPGYVMVDMDMDEHVRYIMKTVRGVYQFLGDEEPKRLSKEEVKQMFSHAEADEQEPKVKIDFDVGDTVRIKEGPFENMEGHVEELLPEKGLVRLTVTIFGRATPVELEYWQLEEI